jgi:ketol-acid reductoisomerase
MDDPSMVMEYVNKVATPKGGDNGVNTKSAVAGKNDMGGTTANIAKSFSTTTGGTQGGLLKPTTGDLASGLGTIQNRVDSKAGKTAFKKSEPGHGPEKAGKKETADNKQSVLKAIKK